MLIVVALIAVGCGLVLYAVRVVNSVQGVVADAYRVWGTGDLLVDYMNANNQQWPASWRQLEAFYAGRTRTYTIIESFDDIQDHIEIDFTFDPASVALDHPDDDPPFRAVWLRNGTNSAYVGAGPNEIVYAHLKRRAFAATPAPAIAGEPSDRGASPGDP